MFIFVIEIKTTKTAQSVPVVNSRFLLTEMYFKTEVFQSKLFWLGVRRAHAAVAGDKAAVGLAAGGTPLTHRAHQDARQLGHQGDPQAQAAGASH